jgi:hypothetical protein
VLKLLIPRRLGYLSDRPALVAGFVFLGLAFSVQIAAKHRVA